MPTLLKRRLVIVTALTGSGGLLAGAGPAAEANDAQVMIDNFTFAPEQIVIAAGTRVRWTNRDDIPHAVTDSAAPRAFRSPSLDTGDSFVFAFDKPGTYRYFCSLHPTMRGAVIVR